MNVSRWSYVYDILKMCKASELAQAKQLAPNFFTRFSYISALFLKCNNFVEICNEKVVQIYMEFIQSEWPLKLGIKRDLKYSNYNS